MSIITGDLNNNILVGTSGDDSIDGMDGADTLYGLGGEDSLQGGTGADRLFGNNENDTLTGDAGDDYLDGGIGNDTMAGGQGNDTYVVDSSGDFITELADEGTDRVFSSVQNYALGGELENLTLIGGASIAYGNALNNVITGNQSQANTLHGAEGNDTLQGGVSNDQLYGEGGDDRLYGGLGADELEGKEGNDYLDGGAGNDLMIGGLGDDTYIVDSMDDAAIEFEGEGVDRVISSVNFNMIGALENLTLTGSAGSGFGNELNNAIVGNAGMENTLDGLMGDDSLTGGALHDTLFGGDGNDRLYGNHGDDSLIGHDGNDYLDGGAGNDYMTGGQGNDTYVVDSMSDSVMEYNDEGIDRVISSVGFGLMGTGVENLTLTGSADSGFGNELNNTIVGNAGMTNTLDGLMGDDSLTGGSLQDTLFGGDGNDRLYGNHGDDSLIGHDGNDYLDGGAGNDYMTGGQGNDTYVVDSTGDMVSEANDEGIDRITSSVSFGLMGTSVENLTLTGAATWGGGNELNNAIVGNAGMANTLDGHMGDDSLTGGSLHDELYGGEGNDRLYGNHGDDALIGHEGNDYLDGGAGDDIMAGGLGNDTYVVDSFGDFVIEQPGEGTDTVRASVDTFLLGAELENLVLTGAAFSGVGNVGSNSITGNDQNNFLDGGEGNDTLVGGLGQDTLYGGMGNDTAVMTEADAPVLLPGGMVAGDSFEGGAGYDTLRLSGAGINLDFSKRWDNDGNVFTASQSAAGTALQGVESIDLRYADGARLTVSLEDVLALSSETDTLIILGGADDAVNLFQTSSLDAGNMLDTQGLPAAAGWSVAGTSVQSGQLCNNWINGSATLIIDSDIMVQSWV